MRHITTTARLRQGGSLSRSSAAGSFRFGLGWVHLVKAVEDRKDVAGVGHGAAPPACSARNRLPVGLASQLVKSPPPSQPATLIADGHRCVDAQVVGQGGAVAQLVEQQMNSQDRLAGTRLAKHQHPSCAACRRK